MDWGVTAESGLKCAGGFFILKMLPMGQNLHLEATQWMLDFADFALALLPLFLFQWETVINLAACYVN